MFKGGFKGYKGAVKTIADHVKDETGVHPSVEEVASLYGKSGHKGAVKTIADRVENEVCLASQVVSKATKEQ
jgi:hypothetical protein